MPVAKGTRHVELQYRRESASPRLTRLDIRLPQSCAGGQGPYLRSVEHLGRSGIAKNPINTKKVNCDGRTDGRMDRQNGV